jgi:crotonobetainyl-CoA:carnitine CoA-transferase CaiB-like acyl-CoA transferase
VGSSALYRIYPTKDNSLFLALLEPAHWTAFAEVVGASTVRGHNFADAQREPVEGALAQALASQFATRSTEEWVPLLDRAGVPCAPILPLPPLFSDEHVAANDLIATHTHPQWGDVRQTGILPKFSRTPATLQCVAPMLGQHTAEVLQEVAGYDPKRTASLLEAGIIKQA